MEAFIIKYLLILLILVESDCLRFFNKGRAKGGNLGEPNTSKSSLLHSSAFVRTKWYEQKLDHFNPRDNTTWKQRYFVNTEFYKPGSPVFLMIGGEAEASDKWMSAGAWVDYAEKHNALLFQLEHRFYGKSQPFVELSVKNLLYLSSEQALADLANFITDMNDEYKISNKWIAFGGSYPGSLAAWLRLKYPHLVHGAVSSSGPLLAEVDFYQYYQVVENALEATNEKCLEAVKQGNEQINILLKKSLGLKKLDKAFRTCENLESLISEKRHLSNFIESLADNFAGVVQYNKDNRIGKTKANEITIDDLCRIMTNQSIGTPVDRLAAVNNLLLTANEENCLEYNYDKMIEELRNTSIEGEGARQWIYQTCTEFGFYQTSSYQPQVFGNKFPVEFFIQQCKDIYGARFDSNFLDEMTKRTNTFYGALDIQVTNVVFVHGSIDPWHALGITKTREQEAPAIYIKGTAHCANMYPKSDDDLPELNQARVEIADLIDKWLRL